MDQDLNKLLYELMAVLTDATKRIGEILCRQATGKVPEIPSGQAELVEHVAQEVQRVKSSLDRVQEPAETDPDKLLDQIEAEIEEEYKEPPSRRRRGRLTITEAELRKLYLEEDLPARIIADRYQVSAAAINQRLRLWGITKRGSRMQTPVSAVEEPQMKESAPPSAAPDRPAVFVPDPDAMRDADAAFNEAEAVPKPEKKKFRLIGRRR